MEKNEEFKDYLNDFAQSVWTLLGNLSQSLSRDSLAVTAIKFLNTAIKSSNLPIAACKYPKVAHLYH
jgi:exportin-2 (importin alpha re-exporter)